MRRTVRGNYILLIVFVVFVSVLLGAFGVLRPVKSVFLEGTQGVVRVVKYPFIKIADFFGVILEIGSLKRTNIELEKDLMSQRVENAELREQLTEYEVLKAQEGFRKNYEWSTLEARIIGRTPDSNRQTSIIDLGEADGVKKNYPVVSAEGVLVGKISDVFAHTAYVAYLTDSSVILSAKDQEARAIGIMTGEHGVSLLLDDLEKEADIAVGDSVVTSGIDGDFPKGLLIGQIESVRYAESDLFQEVTVKPGVEYAGLEYVFVIMTESDE